MKSPRYWPTFDDWWMLDGRYIDPDTSDVPWFHKRKELAALAFLAARQVPEPCPACTVRAIAKSAEVRHHAENRKTPDHVQAALDASCVHHHMNLIKVWVEGYSSSGEQQGHRLLAEITAPDFSAACSQLLADPAYTKYMRLTNGQWFYWGCRLFDNREDAARCFG